MAMYLAAAVMLQAAVAAPGVPRSYRLADSYRSPDFWDKWNFYQSHSGTGRISDVDPTEGFVLYQNRSEAERLGLIQDRAGQLYIGVDTATRLSPGGPGRKSVRLESKAFYGHSLIIAEFAHTPLPRCGIWPAFWTYGKKWPDDGEVDIMEQWNDYKFNRQTLHTGSPALIGPCSIAGAGGMANEVSTLNCDVNARGQGVNEGCSTHDFKSPYGTGYGIVYATEWTSDYWRMWTWSRSEVPEDVEAGTPDPKLWGEANMQSGACEVDRAFTKQHLVINIDFCGVAAGASREWQRSCKARTGYDTCAAYVGAHPEAFADSFFVVKSLDVFTLKTFSTLNLTRGHWPRA